jgi:putative ATPase
MKQGMLFDDFEAEPKKSTKQDPMLRPLADRMRPDTLQEYEGQKKLVAQGQLLSKMIESDQIPSMIFWGPPGVGKTTLAHIIAQKTNSAFVIFSAVQSGIKEIKEVMKEAQHKAEQGVRTIVFVDEIHRFNKAQQDAFLPYVENGSIVLIGATTENPSFEINSALLSRCRTFVLEALDEKDLIHLIHRALKSEKGLGTLRIDISEENIAKIAAFSNGDARFCLNTLEMVVNNSPSDLDGIHVEEAMIRQVLQKRTLLYDKKGEEHYNIISALHKSVRNSDVQAAIYWLARMLEAGEDPLYVARRLVRMASEDIGMADSRALEICVAAYQACHYLGMPECNVHLTHAVTYLCLAPKSNALETAYFAARDDARATLNEPVPLHIRNAPTSLMKDLGYGKDYEYSHDYENHMTDMVCLPERLQGRKYYVPSDQGSEVKVARRMQAIEEYKAMLRKKRGNQK